MCTVVINLIFMIDVNEQRKHPHVFEPFTDISKIHSPLFYCKIVEIERYVLQAAILDECQNYLLLCIYFLFWHSLSFVQQIIYLPTFSLMFLIHLFLHVGVYSVILLPLHPVSLMHKRKIINDMHPVARKERLIEMKIFWQNILFV